MKSGCVTLAETGNITARCERIVRRHLSLLPHDFVHEAATFVSMGLDSLDMITIAMESEEEFGVAVGDDEAADCITFGDFVALISGKLR